jgi:AraC family cel operon transcriptional repressor
MTFLRWSEIRRGRDACHVAYIEAASSAGWVRHGQDYPELFRVDSGRGWHWQDGEERPLRAGDLVYVRAKDSHGFRAEASSEPFAFVNIAFPADEWSALRTRYGWGAHPLFDELASRAPALALDETRDRAAADLFRQMIHAPRDAATRDWFLLSLERLVSGPVAASAPASAPAWLRRALLTYERDDEALREGPARLAALAGCGVAHLGRTMREHLGLTPTEWILRLRVERAARLLAATGYSVAEVALLAGFENLSNFHRRFRAVHRLTPLAYRHRHRRIVA